VTEVTRQGCGKKSDAGEEVEREFAGAAAGDDLEKIVDEEAVGLEERADAYAEVGGAGSIGQFRRADGDKRFAGFVSTFSDRDDAGDRGERCAEIFGPGLGGLRVSAGPKGEFQEQLSVFGIGEERDFLHAFGGFSGTPRLPEGGDAAIDQRRADWALFDRQQFVRGEAEIPGGEIGARSELQARAVAIVPGRRWMGFDLNLKIEPGDALQVLPQDLFLDFQLPLVGDVLVVASAAAGEIGTGGHDAIRRRLDDCIEAGASEAGLLFGERGFGLLLRENEGNENGFAAGPVFAGNIAVKTGAVKVGRKVSEAVSAVD
jgi:hypothetical protein